MARLAEGLLVHSRQPLASPLVIIVTGPPASGKTTIGRPLAAALGLPYFSKDDIKESLFDSLGSQDREWSRRIGLASVRLLFRCAQTLLECSQSFALESNFYPQWDTPRFRELHTHFGCRFIQVVCTADTTTLIDRFSRRATSGDRHPGHADASSLHDLLPRIASERWDALDLPGPVLTIDSTTGQIDIDELVHRLSVLVQAGSAGQLVVNPNAPAD
jgi:predicted kinase